MQNVRKVGSVIQNERKVGSVLVVGAGIAGIQASLDLAESGFYVHLIEQSPAIGGTMPKLDKTFPTNDCSLCILSPKLVECGRHLNIETYTNTDLIDVQGEAGNFKAVIRKRPRCVDLDKCEDCGQCARVCPSTVPSEFNQGISQRKAIYKLYPQAFPDAYCIDLDSCKQCGACEKACPAGAIDRRMQEELLELNVGAIILCPGFETIDPRPLFSYGYGKFPHVLTSLEFERILSASGPFQGHLVRPYDRKEPEKIAWIQCAGSRNFHEGHGYCSSVCCMYATKEAVLAKGHSRQGLDAVIFFMDIRAYDKGLEKYYNRARDEYGVRYIRSRISEVIERQDEKKNLLIRYADADGTVNAEEFDLVVLSTGFKPSIKAVELANKLGLELNQYGFCDPAPLSGEWTTRPGIYVGGAFCGPKGISETVMQASAAASAAGGLLRGVQGSLVRKKVFPQERSAVGEEPRIGVFVCSCGLNIGQVVRIQEVAESARKLPFVVYSGCYLHACSQDSQKDMKRIMAEYRLNRMVIASCSPRTHKPLFQETLREIGLNRYMVEMANIRDQCSWVHMHEPDKATAKAMDLVRMKVAKLAVQDPIRQTIVEVTKSALVVGGGISGMICALSLANEASFEVHLVEKSDVLGGMARRIQQGLRGEDIQTRLREFIDKVNHNPMIKTYVSSEVAEVSGSKGNFVTTLTDGKQIRHGVAIIAIGGEEYKPIEYLYGRSDRIMTYLELEEAIVKRDGRMRGLKNIVLINCVGSREPDRPYCSRVCCHRSIRLALKIKQDYPEAHIFILYRDIRTYGFMEDKYREARSEGILFIRYEVENKPLVQKIGPGLQVTVLDHVLRQPIIIEADFIGLGAAILPPRDNTRLSRVFRVPLNEDGFFLEAHMKLRPVDFASHGIFLAGIAHGPKNLEENITQAKAAASRSFTILSKNEFESHDLIAVVNPDKCAACLTCLRKCLFNAPKIKDSVIEIDASACQGCGSCIGECPSQAITLQGFNNTICSEMTRSLFHE
ncbi:MAG: FAD-dependent oxidoreductase [bacterium]